MNKGLVWVCANSQFSMHLAWAMGVTYLGDQLDNTPHSPETARDLASHGADRAPHEPESGMDHLEHGQTLRVLCVVSQLVEVVAAAQVVRQQLDGAANSGRDSGIVDTRTRGDDEPDGNDQEARPEGGREQVEGEEVDLDGGETCFATSFAGRAGRRRHGERARWREREKEGGKARFQWGREGRGPGIGARGEHGQVEARDVAWGNP